MVRREGRWIDLDEDCHDRDPEEVAAARRRRELMLCSKAELVMMLDMSKDRIAFLDSTIERNTARYYEVIGERDNLNFQKQDAIRKGREGVDQERVDRAMDFCTALSAASKTLLAMDGQPGNVAVASALATTLTATFNHLSEDVAYRVAGDFLARDAMTAILKAACKIPRNNERIMMLYDLALWEVAERIRNKPSDAPESCYCAVTNPPCNYCTDYWCDEKILEMEE